MATRAQRNALKGHMYFLHNHSSQALYQERRPMELTKLTWEQVAKRLMAGKTITSDCSETVTALCKWVGLKSPSGPKYGYSGYGNSETMLAYLPHYTNARKAGVGAIVHFANPDHVAMVFKPSPFRGDPMLFEHGGPGMLLVPLSVERQYHSGPVTFLNVSGL